MIYKRYNIVDKGFYNHSQSNGSILTKQYIIAEEDNKKFLLLRFWNASALVVNGMEIVVTQIGLDKRVIETSVVPIDGIRVNPGDTYTTVSGIVLNDKCVDFKVRVKYFKSGEYEYYERGGKMVAKYRPPVKKSKRSKEYGRAFIDRGIIPSSNMPVIAAVILIWYLRSLAFAGLCECSGNFFLEFMTKSF